MLHFNSFRLTLIPYLIGTGFFFKNNCVNIFLLFYLFIYLHIETNKTIFTTLKTNKMRNLAILPELLSDTNTFKFRKTVEAEMVNFPQMDFLIDVIYKGQRIAILNGLSSPLQWTAKNGSNIPVVIIEKLEKMVVRLIAKSYKINKKSK